MHRGCLNLLKNIIQTAKSFDFINAKTSKHCIVKSDFTESLIYKLDYLRYYTVRKIQKVIVIAKFYYTNHKKKISGTTLTSLGLQ